MGEFIFGILFMGLWLVAVVKDAAADRMGWLLADILMPPLGVVRGLYMLFTGG